MKNYILAFTFLTMTLGYATAQTDSHSSADNLAALCKGWDEEGKSGTYMAGYCMGFIVGVDAEVDTCEGKNVTKGQIIKVAVKYMDDHPEELDQPASSVVRRALQKAFPCKK